MRLLHRSAPALIAVLLATAVPPVFADEVSAKPPVSTPAAVKAARNWGLKSRIALVVDQNSGEVIADRNADEVVPIASLTKLMTALVVLKAEQPLQETLEITREDIDTEKRTPSRLPVGARLTRDQLLLLALMSSENRAASALSRHYPGGRSAFVARMNEEARLLGLHRTHFTESTGLSSRNVSTARELYRLMQAAEDYALIRRYSTQREAQVRVKGGPLKFINSNRLVHKRGGWDIGLQKTGFTNEAGRCLVMQAQLMERPLAMIFLDSFGTLTRYGDASRVRQGLQREAQRRAPVGGSAQQSRASS